MIEPGHDFEASIVVGVGSVGLNLLRAIQSQSIEGIRLVAYLDNSRPFDTTGIHEVIHADQTASQLTYAVEKATVGEVGAIFLVAGPMNKVERQALIQIAHQLHTLEKRVIGVISVSTLPTGSPSPSNEEMMEDLKLCCYGMLIYEPSENTIEHLASTVRSLIDLSQKANDPFALNHILHGKRSITVAKEKASGEDRSQEAVNGIVAQLDSYSTDLRGTSCALLHTSSSRSHRIRIREHTTLIQGVMDYIGIEPRVFQHVNHETEGPSDEIKVELILWGQNLEPSLNTTVGLEAQRL